MKKICYASLLFIFLMVLYNFLKTPKNSEPIYLSNNEKLFQKKMVSNPEVFDIIKKINEKNSKIKNIFSKNIKIKVENITVTGELAMQKEKFFRLKVWHNFLGSQMDVGSNQNYFWFWSKQMKHSELYYSKHKNLNKTMLKTPLNPEWLIASLSLGSIDSENIEIYKFKTFWAIVQLKKNLSNDDITIVTLIDPKQTIVVGRYLYNEQGLMIASAEIKEFVFNEKVNFLIPKNIFIIWYEENFSMEWNMSEIKINSDISHTYWEIPKFKKKIDMSKM